MTTKKILKISRDQGLNAYHTCQRLRMEGKKVYDLGKHYTTGNLIFFNDENGVVDWSLKGEQK